MFKGRWVNDKPVHGVEKTKQLPKGEGISRGKKSHSILLYASHLTGTTSLVTSGRL